MAPEGLLHLAQGFIPGLAGVVSPFPGLKPWAKRNGPSGAKGSSARTGGGKPLPYFRPGCHRSQGARSYSALLFAAPGSPVTSRCRARRTADSTAFYYFALIVTALSIWLMARLVDSPFGAVVELNLLVAKGTAQAMVAITFKVAQKHFLFVCNAKIENRNKDRHEKQRCGNNSTPTR